MRGTRPIDDDVSRIHEDVDRAVRTVLDKLHAHGVELRCGLGCTQCCQDDLSVFEIEAERIQKAAPIISDEDVAPAGQCAFLSSTGSCRIYSVRPYVCRTQGLPLRWLDRELSGQDVERRDLCELNEDRMTLLELAEEECWTLGPFEGRLATLQASCDGGSLRRIPLRKLALELYTNVL